MTDSPPNAERIKALTLDIARQASVDAFEKCAKLCERVAAGHGPNTSRAKSARECADTIRRVGAELAKTAEAAAIAAGVRQP